MSVSAPASDRKTRTLRDRVVRLHAMRWSRASCVTAAAATRRVGVHRAAARPRSAAERRDHGRAADRHPRSPAGWHRAPSVVRGAKAGRARVADLRGRREAARSMTRSAITRRTATRSCTTCGAAARPSAAAACIEQVAPGVKRRHREPLRVLSRAEQQHVRRRRAAALPSATRACRRPSVGKDWRGWIGGGVTSERTGLQVETPMLGFKIGLKEGIEVHVIGLSFGIDLWPPAIIVPLGPGPAGVRRPMRLATRSGREHRRPRCAGRHRARRGRGLLGLQPRPGAAGRGVAARGADPADPTSTTPGPDRGSSTTRPRRLPAARLRRLVREHRLPRRTRPRGRRDGRPAGGFAYHVGCSPARRRGAVRPHLVAHARRRARSRAARPGRSTTRSRCRSMSTSSSTPGGCGCSRAGGRRGRRGAAAPRRRAEHRVRATSSTR